jgi:hypothetical protein
MLISCNQDDQSGKTPSPYSRAKLDSLHAGFNESELTKKNIDLNKDTVTIVTFGHVYTVPLHKAVFDSLINLINAQKPDYIWILGDVVYNNTNEEWDYLLEKYKSINGLRFHAGGNHDMNYHYERYIGKTENQWEAEMRYLQRIGYRYKTIEDDVANYMMINMNDSLDRIKEYMDIMLPELNPDKQSILFTHQNTWHKTNSNPDDPKTWPKKGFDRDSILPELEDFDYLISGDWGEKFYEGAYRHKNKRYKVFTVGNLGEGDDLYITTIKITTDSLWATPLYVDIPDTTSWKENRAKSP